MLSFNKDRKTLEQDEYKYALQDVATPNLYREIFSYGEVPKIPFNHRIVPMEVPEEVWITDTTFRDGQQSLPPFSVKQIVDIYDLLNRLSGPKGVIRQSEFFLYTKKDREAVEKCRNRGYKFPEVTGWIRAVKEDFKIVKEFNIPIDKDNKIIIDNSNIYLIDKNQITLMKD